MDKVKRAWKNLSLRKSIVIYAVFFVLLALILSGVTFFICGRAVTAIREAYPPSGEKYYLTNENGEQLGEGGYIGTAPASISEKDERRISFLEAFPIAATPIYSAACILAAALLFYRDKLKTPLSELKMASEKISKNDLGFSIAYKSKDELGQLCASFETMRSALAQNFSDMWRQMEERKQLNAAFAHDLRTPLTVLKGYDEILQASGDEQTRDAAVTMGKHIARLEQYISSMGSLRRLEDAQPEYRVVPLQDFLSSLHESAEILCTQAGKKLYLHNRTGVRQLSIDTQFVSQVCNNLLSNAARYAAASVIIAFEDRDGGLLLSVSDDGKGFDGNSLQNAAKPYYTEEGDHSTHFGLGLYICKTLCEHHGGYLTLENISNGANATAFFKAPPCR